MSAPERRSALQTLLDDRAGVARILVIVGIGGVVASLVVGVAGWILAGRAVSTVSETLGPANRIVVNLADSIEATGVIVSRTTEAIDSIEGATRSTARTLDSISEVLDEVAELAGGGMADSLDSAVDTLPGLISTGRVVDRTMRALSLVGVDYDPEVPLDQALTELEASLAPIPDQVRDQVELLDTVDDNLTRIAADSGELAAVLLQARIDMMSAERVLVSASENAAAAAESVVVIEAEIATFEVLARIVAVAAALALLAGGLAPLLLGLHMRQEERPT